MHKQKNLNTDPPKTHDELAEEFALARKLLPFMARGSIPPTPKNYRIFYDYLKSSNPQLNKLVDELLSQSAIFDATLTETLYNLIYSGEQSDYQIERLSTLTKGLGEVSQIMGKDLDAANGQTGRYQKLLSQSNQNMKTSSLTDEILKRTVEELLSETENTLAVQGLLKKSIEEANQTIYNLQQELSAQTQLAHLDELTKLYNRRYMNAELPRYLKKGERNTQPLSLIVLDLDHFKNINDRWGHQVGDQVLSLCAQAIKKACRKNDLPIRYGGEEFLLICPGTAADSAFNLAERIRKTISDTDITVRGALLPITISAGVAQYQPGETQETLFERVDQALYQAKKEGRNRVVLF